MKIDLANSQPIHIFRFGPDWCASGVPVKTEGLDPSNMTHVNLAGLEAGRKGLTMVSNIEENRVLSKIFIDRGYLLPDFRLKSIRPPHPHRQYITFQQMIDRCTGLSINMERPRYIYPAFNKNGEPVVSGIYDPRLLTTKPMSEWWSKKIATTFKNLNSVAPIFSEDEIIDILVKLHQIMITRYDFVRICTDPTAPENQLEHFKELNYFVNHARTEMFDSAKMKAFRQIIKKMNYHRVISRHISWYSGNREETSDIGTESAFAYLPGSLIHLSEAYEIYNETFGEKM